MIHVCFALNDATGRYSKFTGTSMLSLFGNIIPLSQSSSVTVHILHDNTLTNDNREKFIYLAGQYNQFVKFYNLEELCAEKVARGGFFYALRGFAIHLRRRCRPSLRRQGARVPCWRV